ncbi:hypothetical protein FAZ79_00445 [Guyparkeria sp. SB14A]|uniref:hypothetical protein n=1 Tax=Guyparkeria sp. SB14A TaxID=2571147 RepID=UPI0010ACBBDE|nr:hypothetical protein [Guyparkeria sp. SB14A]TKA91808.1 hypothetical protein FAZ79_00445 [Guyparkeria sp. SB14A]
MASMLDLEIAVLNQDHDKIQSLIGDLDRKTELEMFRKAADHFGFNLLEHRGRGYAMRSELARVFGYGNESGLRRLCERHDTESIPVGALGEDAKSLAVKALGIKRNDGKTTLVAWDTFLIAGMESQTDASKTVKAYLLQMERAGRVAGGALDIAKSRELRLKEADRVSMIAARLDRMKDNTLRRKVSAYLDEVLDGALDIDKQRDLFALPEAKDAETA